MGLYLTQMAGFGSGDGDPYWPFVSMLLHMNGANAGTSFPDAKGLNTMTANGNVQTSTAQYKFNGSSGLFDGNTDYLTSNSNSFIAFGTGDFTIEVFIRLTTGQTGWTIMRSDNSGAYIDWNLTTTTFKFNLNGTVIYEKSYAFSMDTWYHLAVRRAGTTLEGFVNGASLTGVTNSTNFGTPTTFRIGGNSFGTAYDFKGNMAELRVTKGIARPNIIVPSSPYPNQ